MSTPYFLPLAAHSSPPSQSSSVWSCRRSSPPRACSRRVCLTCSRFSLQREEEGEGKHNVQRHISKWGKKKKKGHSQKSKYGYMSASSADMLEPFCSAAPAALLLVTHPPVSPPSHPPHNTGASVARTRTQTMSSTHRVLPHLRNKRGQEPAASILPATRIRMRGYR